jgi:hypothetical protein
MFCICCVVWVEASATGPITHLGVFYQVCVCVALVVMVVIKCNSNPVHLTVG